MSKEIKILLNSKEEKKILQGLRNIEKHNFLELFSFILPIINSQNIIIRKEAIKTSSICIKGILSDRNDFEQNKTKKSLANILMKLNPRIISEIIDLFNDKDLDKKFDALYIMRSLNNPKEASQLLMASLKEKNQIIRACAVKTLGRLATLKDVSIISRFLKDADGRVRANAVEALDESHKKDNIAILLRFKQDTNNRVRGNVLKALYKMGHKNIIIDLESMLSSNSELMRASACWTIGEIGKDSEVVFMALLQLVSEDESKLVQTNLLRAKAKIKGIEEKLSKSDNPNLSKEFKNIREKIISKSGVTFNIEKTTYFTIIKLEGNLNIYSMLPLKMKIHELLDNNNLNIALDFKKVIEVDQSVINFISNLNIKVKELEGKFMLFNLSSDVSDIFHFGNLDGRVLLFLETEDVTGIIN